MARTTTSPRLQTLRAALANARRRIRDESAGGHLSGRTLLLARVLWGAAAAILVGIYVFLLPACWAQLQTVCRGAHCALVQPSPASARTLHQMLGLSVGGYAALTFSLILLTSLVPFATAGVILWRRSEDRMALLVALSQVALGTELAPFLLETGRSTVQLLALVVNALDWVLLFLVFTLFPSGRFVPRWARWLVVGWVAAGVAIVVSYLLTAELHFTPYLLTWLVGIGSVVGTQVYRYRAVSSPLEQAQTRWVVFGLVVGFVIVLAIQVPTVLFPALGQPGSIYYVASGPAFALPLIVFSVCLGVAILRYRLYDIDVIIRRTVIYSLVTGTLAAVYAVSSIVLQAGFQAFTRQGSALATVGSTLAITALFLPVRRRVQAVVDRRFYRRKYDAARTVEAFGQTLRHETDLARLSGQLVAVVEETMQPSQVSLWLVGADQPAHEGEPAARHRQRAEPAEADAARNPKPVPLSDVFAVRDGHTG